MNTITVIGPGAIGGLIAARLGQSPANELTIAARTEFDALRLEAPGEVLESASRLVMDPCDTGPADWILVATKAYDSEAAAAWFSTALGSHTTVAILQNGVNHVERFAGWLPRDRILPVIVDCPAERVAPGHVRQRGPAVLTVPSSDIANAFRNLFSGTGVECRVVEDFVSAAWWKLCLNAAGVINALTLKPARIAHDATAAGLMRSVVEEAAAVGRAEGADLPPDIADEVIGIYCSHPPDSVNSLHADRAANRPMEIEIRNGIIVELGKRHGIATPCNEMAVALLTIE